MCLPARPLSSGVAASQTVFSRYKNTVQDVILESTLDP